MLIRDLLTEDVVVAEMAARDKKSALSELCRKLAERRSDLDADRLLSVLLNREGLGSTGIGHGIAIPHGKLAEISSLVTGFGRSRRGVDFGSMDQKPAHLFFVLFAPTAAPAAHLDALARISRILQDDEVRARLMDVEDPSGILDVIQSAERKLEESY